jgi:GAF domain-containing protein
VRARWARGGGAAAGAEVLTTVGLSERIAEEQAALRRVATLVASGAPPAALFAAVTEEVGRVLAADVTIMGRFGADGAATIVGTWTSTGVALPTPVDGRVEPGGQNVTTRVFETGRPARLDHYADASGAAADAARGWGLRSLVGVPISVEGRLWGVIVVAYTHHEPLPADAEARLAAFTELVATAIANAQARAELRGFAEEQSALRRVATLVARASAPEAVFAAVAEEVGRVLSADVTILSRYDPDGAATVVGTSGRTGAALSTPVGSRFELGGRNVHTLVRATRRPARVDRADASGAAAEVFRSWAIRSCAGVPISVEGRLWGVMVVVSTREDPLPADTEARLAGFTELVATAIANVQARVELRGFATEQAALRRVATLAARAAPAEEVFAAVTAEVGRVLSAGVTVLNRYDPDGTESVLGAWSSTGAPPIAVGTRVHIGGQNVSTLVFQTGRPARMDDYADSTGAVGDIARGVGVRASVGVPISVDGRLWGVVIVASPLEQPLPADTEERLAGFTELAATAIANAEAQAALTASRARIVAAADTTRRRIERDLHDGAQQRLVSLALQLRAAQAAMPAENSELAAQLDPVADGLTGVLDELREIARGIHPAALAEGGLRPALKTLARRSAVPVRLDVQATNERFPEPIEIAAYYVVCEALTNAAKHASATLIDVRVATSGGVLHVAVRDDGHGGADLSRGTGLVGLTDRVEALGGRLWLHSPPGAGTTVAMELPLTAPGGPASLAGIDGRPRSSGVGRRRP